MRFFEGSWRGTGNGQVGESKVERTYQFILDGAFLQVISSSVYEPQEKNPNGETHREMGMYSFDKARDTFIFRQFHNEKFVNRYFLEKPTIIGNELVFTSEAIENFGEGWRARESYKIINQNEFIEIFELAAPGKEFSVFLKNRLTRRK